MFQLPCQIDDSFPSLLLSPTNCGNQFRIQRYYDRTTTIFIFEISIFNYKNWMKFSNSFVKLLPFLKIILIEVKLRLSIKIFNSSLIDNFFDLSSTFFLSSLRYKTIAKFCKMRMTLHI